MLLSQCTGRVPASRQRNARHKSTVVYDLFTLVYDFRLVTDRNKDNLIKAKFLIFQMADQLAAELSHLANSLSFC